MFTVRPVLVTEDAVPEEYKVVLSEPLSDTHSGEPGAALVPGDAAMPQALTRSVSVNGATPGMSDTKLTWRKPDGCGPAAAAPAGKAPAAIVISVPAATTAAVGHSRSRLIPAGHGIAERKVR
jgi:hypothetical protein